MVYTGRAASSLVTLTARSLTAHRTSSALITCRPPAAAAFHTSAASHSSLIKDAAKNAATSAATNHAQNKGDQALAAAKETASKVTEAPTSTFQSIKNAFTGTNSQIVKDAASQQAQLTGGRAAATAKEVTADAADASTSAWGSVKNTVQDAAKPTSTTAATAHQAELKSGQAVAGTREAASEAAESTSSVWQSVKDTVKGTTAPTSSTAAASHQAELKSGQAVAGTREATSKVADSASSAWGSVKDTVKDAAAPTSATAAVSHQAELKSGQAVAGTREAASKVADSTSSAWESVKDTVKGATAPTPSTAATAHQAELKAGQAVAGTREATSKVADSVSSAWGSVKDTVKDAAAPTSATAAASHQVALKGGQVIASAKDTAAKLADSPPSPINVAAASPSTSSWGGGRGSKKGSGIGRSIKSTFNATLFLAGGTLLFFYYRDSRAAIHRWIAIPALKYFLDPEAAQKLAIDLLVSGIAPVDVVQDDELLKTELFGMTLSNPLGLAAGFDKQAEAIDGLFDLGFGIVEVGSVTPEPQPGNPQPRYFRLQADDAAINRFGFNSDGHGTVLARLRSRLDRWLLATDALAPSSSAQKGGEGGAAAGLDSRTSVTPVPHTAEQLPDLVALDAEAALLRAGEVNPRPPASADSRLSLRPDRLLSINLGKNKTTPEAMAVRDYILGIHALGPYADMLVVNISSPNTPGLRDLQRAEVLGSLLGELVKARDEMVKEQQELASNVSCPAYSPSTDSKRSDGPLKPNFRIPLLLKVAPDLSEPELDDIAEAVKKAKIDGLIVSNTTVQRPRSLLTSHDDPVVNETGGLSGRPLKPLSLRALRHLSSRLEGEDIPLIGCGGIFSGADALEFARAGASAVQIYTSFGYTGVGAPRRIKDELVELLKKEGKSWKELVGSDARAASS
ncbi:hypothetical protein A4X09_0g4552 [Tilletia walkeri]|uniref:Dihydroorotate dehydrogenase (quinone), mitochondrial n=1 Tax=Tilletia walkeri TaxID=117179 RepID=A0A8X7T3V1_9BASI|nr:hypothetical protein A4X09_0g4552 [Tilletia walkeri]